MEIASTSSNLRYQFPTDQRYEIKDVGCKSTSSSLLHTNPNLRRNCKEKRDVVTAATSKKRKHTDEEKPPEKRQKKIFEEASKFKITKPVLSFATLHVTKRKSKVFTAKPGRDKTEDQDHSFKDLIAKAREKVQEKRQIDHRNTDIRSQRIAARLALNQMEKTAAFDDHLEYHMELEKLGCDFISDQVSCLKKFRLLSRADYYI